MKWYFWAYSDFRDAILIKLKGKSWWVLDTEAAWFINSIPTYTYFMTCSKKNIIIRNYAYLWKYVTKIVNSLTLSQLDSGWWSSARKCKEWKWGRWKGARETSIRLMKSTSQMHNSQQLACFLTLLNWTFISVKYDPSKIVSILKKPKSIETFSIFYHILYTCPVNSQPSQNLVSLINDNCKSSQLGR